MIIEVRLWDWTTWGCWQEPVTMDERSLRPEVITAYPSGFLPGGVKCQTFTVPSRLPETRN
jgi:hypothetical protein